MSILFGILTFALMLISGFLILVILAQKTKDGGMGAALGGGATESAFGHETGNVLTTATIYSTIAFFVLSFVLYLGQIYTKTHRHGDEGLRLPDAPSAPARPSAVPTSLPAAGTTTSATGALAPVPVPGVAPTTSSASASPAPAH